ncbi:MAG: TRAP transporter small permease subunit [Pseudomonadota bacterium]|nr:MAG: sugar transporter [Pseudomonadota bacterium]
MQPLLLRISRHIDRWSARFGALATACVLLACAVSAGNAISRYALDASSNAWLELQWYLFAGVVMLGAAHTLRRNEHVRVDLFYSRLSVRAQAWVDVLGLLLFLFPAVGLLAWFSWPMFLASFQSGEVSLNAGGLVRWPVKLLLPLGFALVLLQGLSELIKRIALLRGDRSLAPEHYERPQQ